MARILILLVALKEQLLHFLINKNIKKSNVTTYFNSLNMENIKLNVIESELFNHKLLKFLYIDSDILS